MCKPPKWPTVGIHLVLPAKRAFDVFLTAKALTANQIQFVNLVIDYLTQAGWMSAAQLYESPFTDYSAKGVEGISTRNR